MTNRELFLFLSGLACSLGGIVDPAAPPMRHEESAFTVGRLAPRFARVAAEAVMSTAGLTLGFGSGSDLAQVDAAFAKAQARYADGSLEWRMLDALRHAWRERASQHSASGTTRAETPT